MRTLRVIIGIMADTFYISHSSKKAKILLKVYCCIVDSTVVKCYGEASCTRFTPISWELEMKRYYMNALKKGGNKIILGGTPSYTLLRLGLVLCLLNKKAS